MCSPEKAEEFQTVPRVPLDSQSPHPTTFKVTRATWSTKVWSTTFSVLIFMTQSMVGNTGDYSLPWNSLLCFSYRVPLLLASSTTLSLALLSLAECWYAPVSNPHPSSLPILFTPFILMVSMTTHKGTTPSVTPGLAFPSLRSMLFNRVAISHM